MSPPPQPSVDEACPPSSEPVNTVNPPDEQPAAAESFRRLWSLVAELRSYAEYYLKAQIDRLRLSVRQIVVLAALAILGLVVLATVLAVAVVFFLLGVAGALGSITHIPWVGDLGCGVLVLTIFGLAIWFYFGRFCRASRSTTVKNYEREHLKQRSEFGHDVVQRAAERENR